MVKNLLSEGTMSHGMDDIFEDYLLSNEYDRFEGYLLSIVRDAFRAGFLAGLDAKEAAALQSANAENTESN